MEKKKLLNDKNFSVRLKAAIDTRFMESGLKEMALYGNGTSHIEKTYQEVQKAFFDSLDELEIEQPRQVSLKEKLVVAENMHDKHNTIEAFFTLRRAILYFLDMSMEEVNKEVLAIQQD